jgi:hypothetical protein
MMAKRRGRPPIETAKLDRKLEFLVTRPTFNRLCREARDAGYQSLSAFLRVRLDADETRNPTSYP